MGIEESISVESETWVETQPQEMVGFAWRCKMCDEEKHRVYSFESVERDSAQHLREHGINPER
jgi:hypothetical protein